MKHLLYAALVVVSIVPHRIFSAEKIQTLSPPHIVIDSHMHIVGLGTDNSGCYVNPNQTSWGNPLSKIKTTYMISKSGVKDLAHADRQYVDHLAQLIKSFPDKRYFGLVFAFTPTYDKDGKLNLKKTGLAVPNNYVLKLVKEHPTMIPVGSVHPYQPDAKDEIKRLAHAGVRLLKLLPNSMHFSPGDQDLEMFFKTIVEESMLVIAHVGDEHSVSGGGIHNEHGNPWHYQQWLQKFPSLKIIFAHVGSEGESLNPEGRSEDNFYAVVKLLKKYPRQAYADISAFSIAFKRVNYLKSLLEETSIHQQLLFGSDYPLPNFSVLTNLNLLSLWAHGLASFEEITLLRQVQLKNPLEYNYQFLEKVSYRGHHLPAEVFNLNFLRMFRKETLPQQLQEFAKYL